MSKGSVLTPRGSRRLGPDHPGISEPLLDVSKGALEDRFPVAVRPVGGSARPVGMQVAEEAPLRMWLDPKHIPVAVAEGRDPVRRAARIPGILGLSALVIDEPEHDLVVLDELPEHALPPAVGKQELSFGVRGDDRDDVASLQFTREGARAPVVESQATGPALVVARVVRREDGLRGLRHRPPERGQEPRLDEDLESVTGAEHGLARLDELRRVRSELAPQSSGEYRPGANVEIGIAHV